MIKFWIVLLSFSLQVFATDKKQIPFNLNYNPYNQVLNSYPAYPDNNDLPCTTPAVPPVLSNEFISDYKNFFPKQKPSQSLCKEGNEGKIKALVESKGRTLDQAEELRSAVKRSDVFIAGEIHLYTDLKARQDVIDLFKKQKGPRACVAFELPQKFDHIDKLIQELKDRAAEVRKSEDIYGANEMDDFITYYHSMVTFSQVSGLQTFAVDHADNFEKDLSNALRNEVMVKNIHDLIQSKKCSSVLLFVGKAHETQDTDPSDPALSELFKRKSLKTVSLNIQMTEERSQPMEARSWSDCRHISFDHARVLPKSQLPKDARLFPWSLEKTLFSDYDFTYFLPQTQKDFPCSNCFKEN